MAINPKVPDAQRLQAETPDQLLGRWHSATVLLADPLAQDLRRQKLIARALDDLTRFAETLMTALRRLEPPAGVTRTAAALAAERSSVEIGCFRFWPGAAIHSNGGDRLSWWN